MNASLYDFLREHCQWHLVESYLEIGTRDGDSLRVVVKHSVSLRRITVCDVWGNDYGGSGRGNHEHIDRLLHDECYTGDVQYLDGNSRDTVPTLKARYDLVLVDGDHSYEGGMADLVNTWPLVKRGGCVAFHDITHPAHPDLMACFDAFVESRRSEIDGWRTIMAPYGVGVIIKK